ncbi:hypothetical protein MKW94_008213 [Papaver nudicaule]|uniref:Reticulon-like protein n=1 Tax=Papaver nudicaule TaxID=74823 RepID=A0AA41VGF9_PAPNU|nr:hypothetical protein [Papaver nudicaule]
MDAITPADSSAAEKDPLMTSQSHHKKSVHQFLGEGSVADVLLWEKQATSATLLVSSSIIWFLFERAGYNPLLFVSNSLLVLVVTLFFWGKSAHFLNRPPPSLPHLEISDDSMLKISSDVHVIINRVLETGHAIIVGGNMRLLLKVIVSMWLVAFIGGLFNFITLVYIGLVISLTVPALYNSYQDHIDDKLIAAHKVISTQLGKFNLNILSNIQSQEKKLH